MNDGRADGLRFPPYSLEAEAAVLGGLLIKNDSWDRIVSVIAPDDFYLSDHRRIFDAIAGLVRERRGADVVTVSEAVKSAGGLSEGKPPLAYLHELASTTPSAANIVHYAEIVHDRATLRRVISAGVQASELGYDPHGATGSVVLERAQELFSRIATASAKGRGELFPLADYVSRTLQEIEEAFNNRDKRGVSGISTGFFDLDDTIGGGLKPGQLVVIAGRPGMGKSAIALNILEHVAIKLGLAGAIFSMEMHATQLAKRFLAGMTNIHGLRLAHGRIDDHIWAELGKAAPKLHDAPIFLNEDGYLTISEITANCRKLKRQQPSMSLVVVDYLGLMRIERPSSNRAQDLAEISRGLKALAKELALPIILLAQLNREVEKRGDKRPVLSDLRDSGEIEADADLVIMLYREAVYKEMEANDPDRGRAEILIRKQRDGPTGKLLLHYADWCTRFSDWNPR
jgi:replicative DNA helicase